jgi:hypothetical protein
MQTITPTDKAVALTDAFRCLVKELDKAGVVRLADLAKELTGLRRWGPKTIPLP